jgi:putative phosphonate transport system ATP-binding protein
MSVSDDRSLLVADGLTKHYGPRIGCEDVALEIHEGEVVAVVGESGSGKSTLLGLLSTQIQPTAGSVHYRFRDGSEYDLFTLGEAQRRFLLRTDWGFVHQDARLGLRMGVSAGGNVGERLMAALRPHSRRGRELARAGRDRAWSHR